MKIKLIPIAALLGLSLSAVSAQAITLTDVIREQNGAELTFSGKITDNEGKLMIKVYNTAYNESDKAGFVKLTSAEPDENGIVKFSVTIPEDLSDGTNSTGDYAIVYSDGKSKKSYPFKYMNTGDSLPIYEKLSTYTASQLFDELKTQFLQDIEKVGADIDVYGKLDTEKTNALDWFCANRSGSLNDMIKTLNDSMYTVYIEDCSEAESLYIAQKLNPLYGGVSFSSLTQAEQEKIALYMSKQTYTKLTDNALRFGEGLAISKLSKASRGEVGGLFEKYANVTGLDANAKYIAYKSKSPSVQERINEKFVLEVENNNGITSKTDIITMFETAYGAVVTSNPAPPSGGGGGGGGGSSSSGSASGAGAAVTPYIPVTGEDENTSKAEFSDVLTSHWANREISLFVKKEIVSGYADGSFMPDKAVTREEFVKLLINAAGLYESGLKADFDDVSEDAWYAPYIACAKKSGLVNGVSGAEFGVGRTLTREDMAVIMYRAAKSDGKNLEKVREYADFNDEANIADYAKDSVRALYEARLINGMDDGSFASKAPLTRAQAVKVLYDMYYGG